MSVGEVMTTSSTGGQKAGNDVRMSLPPVRELLEVAELYGKGAKKYSDHNWAKGYEWSKSYDAMMRHAMEWWAGNEFDEGEGGTGQEHLDAVIFHALTLKYFRKHFPEFDDRFKIPKRMENLEWAPNSNVSVVVGGDNPSMDSQLPPKKVDKLDEEWMRQYTWTGRYGRYEWRDNEITAGWYRQHLSSWRLSGENYVDPGEESPNGPFTRD